VLADHRLAGANQFVHLITRKREPSADRKQPRPHFGLVEIGQVDAQHAPSDIIASVPVYNIAATATHLAQAADDILDRALDGDDCLKIVGTDLRAGGGGDDLPEASDDALLGPAGVGGASALTLIISRRRTGKSSGLNCSVCVCIKSASLSSTRNARLSEIPPSIR